MRIEDLEIVDPCQPHGSLRFMLRPPRGLMPRRPGFNLSLIPRYSPRRIIIVIKNVPGIFLRNNEHHTAV